MEIELKELIQCIEHSAYDCYLDTKTYEIEEVEDYFDNDEEIPENSVMIPYFDETYLCRIPFIMQLGKKSKFFKKIDKEAPDFQDYFDEIIIKKNLLEEYDAFRTDVLKKFSVEWCKKYHIAYFEKEDVLCEYTYKILELEKQYNKFIEAVIDECNIIEIEYRNITYDFFCDRIIGNNVQDYNMKYDDEYTQIVSECPPKLTVWLEMSNGVKSWLGNTNNISELIFLLTENGKGRVLEIKMLKEKKYVVAKIYPLKKECYISKILIK